MNILKRLFRSLFGLTDEEKILLELTNLNLDNYTGRKYQLYNNGKLVIEEDTRDIRYEKLKKLYELDEISSDVFWDKAPIHKQLNALAGRYNDSETEAINTTVNDLRNKIQFIKNNIIGSTTLSEIDRLKIELK